MDTKTNAGGGISSNTKSSHFRWDNDILDKRFSRVEKMLLHNILNPRYVVVVTQFPIKFGEKRLYPNCLIHIYAWLLS